jgi:hypothetical protein
MALLFSMLHINEEKSLCTICLQAKSFLAFTSTQTNLFIQCNLTKNRVSMSLLVFYHSSFFLTFYQGTAIGNIGNLYVVHSQNTTLDYKLSSVSSSPSYFTLSHNGKNGYLVDSLTSDVITWDLATDKITKRVSFDCETLGRLALPASDDWFYVPCSSGAVYMYKEDKEIINPLFN